MSWVWDRFPVFWALAQKISQFYITYYIEITCHYMATWSVQKLWIRAVARWEILGKTLKVELLQTCFVIEDFGSNRTGTGILFWTDFWFKMLLTFKASMPLLANLTFRNGRFLVSVGSPTLTVLKSLFEEISKIIPWSRCPGDPTSGKCKVKMDSYKACSRFNGREYSFVRIWWRPNCKLTNGKSPSNETSCISGLLYFLEPWLRCLLLYNRVIG